MGKTLAHTCLKTCLFPGVMVLMVGAGMRCVWSQESITVTWGQIRAGACAGRTEAVWGLPGRSSRAQRGDKSPLGPRPAPGPPPHGSRVRQPLG